ncbi:hypothetical protein RchiOBHm_Chr2g0176391 [Rosa chinensis]|uniref:Transmembrane protein n=1 Tax=Rosa chinensis TaxID=74649 RepID=A0A2P6S6L9_ROSCH|nr:hypothetical protein RchiOBHm_Chr2g0176391 [Rosa chinensis]
MASIAKLSSAGLAIVIFFANLHALCSTSVPTISASPAVSPYEKNAPNMSSFFPNSSSSSDPSSQWPLSPPNSASLAPVPSSGEFVGKVSSANSYCRCGGAIYYAAAAGVFCLFVLKFLNAV